ncbi:hypothetical protein C5167_036096 [Papaver somniferum]|nr:hypothetical protein C5167_036096 [Papaver somniferum]
MAFLHASCINSNLNIAPEGGAAKIIISRLVLL